MIKVSKPIAVPNILSTTGKTTTISNCALYDANPTAYNSGKLKITILSSIYNDSVIKATLKKAQYGKCCFCEKHQHDEYGAVEHYRPKSAYKTKRKEKLKKPGYYWLGYTWTNLFFVCGPCNTKKGNIFPLNNETNRVKNHKGNISVEKPLLLDPSGRKDPTKHIKFNDELPYGVSTEGKQTIEICKLDREGLNKERRLHLDLIEDKVLIIISNRDPAAVIRAVKYIKGAIKPEAKFSSMTANYLSKLPIVLV
jgi:uncharacterized protein (TIGR02646 family)